MVGTGAGRAPPSVKSILDSRRSGSGFLSHLRPLLTATPAPASKVHFPWAFPPPTTPRPGQHTSVPPTDTPMSVQASFPHPHTPVSIQASIHPPTHTPVTVQGSIYPHTHTHTPECGGECPPTHM